MALRARATAIICGTNGNYLWYYLPRRRLRLQKQELGIPNCWMNVDPPNGAKQAVLAAVRTARAK
jgi:hypothetical protein